MNLILSTVKESLMWLQILCKDKIMIIKARNDIVFHEGVTALLEEGLENPNLENPLIVDMTIK